MDIDTGCTYSPEAFQEQFACDRMAADAEPLRQPRQLLHDKLLRDHVDAVDVQVVRGALI